MLTQPKICPYLLMIGLNFGLVTMAFAQFTPSPIVSPKASTADGRTSTDKLAEYPLSGKWLYCVTRGSGNTAETDLVISTIDGTQSKVLHRYRGRVFALNGSFYPGYVTYTVSAPNAYPVAYLLDLQTAHTRILTPYRANNLGASVSPDGEQFIFSSDLDGNLELYQSSISQPILVNRHYGENATPETFNATKNLTRLTNEPNADISPSWSPDGQSFVFVSDRQAVLHPQIYRYDLATKTTTPINTQDDYATEAKFNATGDKITLLNRSQGAIFDLKTGKKKAVNNEGLYEAPIFSPDGNFVAYSTGKNLVVIPETRLWEKSRIDEADKIVITPILPKGVTGTIRRPIWLP